VVLPEHPWYQDAESRHFCNSFGEFFLVASHQYEENLVVCLLPSVIAEYEEAISIPHMTNIAYIILHSLFNMSQLFILISFTCLKFISLLNFCTVFI
jgi:hypothetical protein